MAKTKISEFSATPANNTDIDSINIAEGCAPSGINNAIRELMAQLKDFQTGAVGDSFNGPVGTTTAAAGAFTTLSASGTLAVTGVATLTAQPILSSLTASKAVFSDASKGLVSNDITGTGNVVMSASPTLTGTIGGANATLSGTLGVTGVATLGAGAILNTPASVTLTNGTGLPLTTGTTGTLPTTKGGTGLTSFTANGVVYASSTSALATGSALNYASGTGVGNLLEVTGGSNNVNGQLNIQGTDGTNTSFVSLLSGLEPTNLPSVMFSNGLRFALATNKAASGYSEQMRLTSTGLGIGTSSPFTKLGVVGNAIFSGSTPYIAFAANQSGSTPAYLLYTNSTNQLDLLSSGAIDFQTGASTTSKMRLDSSGNLGLGVTPSAWGADYKAMQIGSELSLWSGIGGAVGFNGMGSNFYVDASGNATYLRSSFATNYQQNRGSGIHAWYTTPSGTAGAAISFTQAMTLTSGGDLLVGTTQTSTRSVTVGSISSGASGSSIGLAGTNAGIYFGAAGTPTGSGGFGSNAAIARAAEPNYHIGGSAAGDLCIAPEGTKAILFGTSASAGSTSERARIDSSGNLLVGTTSSLGIYKIQAEATGSYQAAVLRTDTATSGCADIWNRATTGNNVFFNFLTEAGGTQRGSVTYNRAGGLTTYNTTSDYRAKDILGGVTDSGAIIDSTPVYMGKMKGATQERPMFIAHETPPYAHTGEKDAVDADGNPVYQQMDASSLVPVMWAEIQDLRKRLAAAGI